MRVFNAEDRFTTPDGGVFKPVLVCEEPPGNGSNIAVGDKLPSGTPVLQVLPPALRREFGELCLSPHKGAPPKWQGVEVGLNPRQSCLVATMVQGEGSKATYRALYEAFQNEVVDDSEVPGLEANVRSLIRRIRPQFKKVDAGFNRIKNVYGFGYQWLIEE